MIYPPAAGHRTLSRAGGKRARHADQGFTLIEVVLAITILGISYAAILGAFSGSLKLLRQASEYQNALLLARSKLDETWIDPSLDIADQEAEEKYGGVTYAYKIEIRNIPLLEGALKEKVKLPIKLEEIAVEVFWGKSGSEKSYKLTSYKMSPVDPAQQPTAAPAGPAAPTPGAAKPGMAGSTAAPAAASVMGKTP